MNCKGVNSKLTSFLEGTLDNATSSYIEMHLKGCKPCSEALARLRDVYATLEQEKMLVPINPYIAQKVWDKVHGENVPTASITVPMRRLYIASIAAAGIAFGIFIGTLLNSTVGNADANKTEQFTQLADDYFPSDFYSPYDDLNPND